MSGKKRRPSGGRPSRLTASLQRQICRAIELGNHFETAAELVGIGRTTVYHWIALGDDGDEKYREFRDAVKRARAHAEARAVARVLKAGRRTWQANAWFLERSFPEHWRRRGQQEEVPVAAPTELPLETVGERLELALARDPTQIARALAALQVLEEIAGGTAASTTQQLVLGSSAASGSLG